MSKPRVFVDTCIIIEAFRINCWKALCARYDVETVEECIAEACTGDPQHPGRVIIDRDALVAGLAQRHAVDKVMLATFVMDHPDLPGIDAGEKHLLAWLHAHQPVDASLLISTTDKAALKATHMLAWLDHVRSLEVLAKGAGVDKKQLGKLENHFSESWMSTVRIQLEQGTI